jgi:predicted double-glycine peptidase
VELKVVANTIIGIKLKHYFCKIYYIKMALYRFRVTFEDYDDVMREIDVKSNQTFEDLHRQFISQQVTIPNILLLSISAMINGQKAKKLPIYPTKGRIDRGVSR